MEKIPYTVKHVGINNAGTEEAKALTDVLCGLFGLEITQETPIAFFAGTIFEVMKSKARGAHGHIALQTPDVDLAMADLKAKGVKFLPETARYDADGKCTFIYLDLELGGFAFHLTT